MGLFRGCIESQAPVHHPVSKGARKYTDKRMLEAIIRIGRRHFPERSTPCISTTAMRDLLRLHRLRLLLQRDDRCLTRDFEENIAITKRWWSGPMRRASVSRRSSGCSAGVEEGHPVDEKHRCLTNPRKAVEFVQQTGCDALAAAIGTATALTIQGQQSLHFNVIEAIQQKIPGTPDRDARQLQRARWRKCAASMKPAGARPERARRE
jgi:fructose-bisphosphate aldolase class II